MKRKRYKGLYLLEKMERETYQKMFDFLLEELKRTKHIQVIDKINDIPYKLRTITINEDHKYLCDMAISEYNYKKDIEEE